jgi:hypothetical protein
MSTNRQVITASLRMLNVIDANETPATEDAELALTELNALMASLAADGIDLGFPPQDNLSDEFPLDEQTESQVKPLLAVMLLPYYPLSNQTPVLGGRAEQARAQLLRASIIANMEEAVAAVPLGSGRGSDYDISTGE